MRRFINTLKQLLGTSALFVCLFATPVLAVDKEQAVKAAYLYNFTKFIAWPAELSVNKLRNINICVIGSNSLGEATKLFSQGSTANLTISAKLLATAPTTKGECHIAFISSSEKSRALALTQALQATSTLAVSDIDGFASNGGMIGFVNEKNKIRLIVNKTIIEQAGLEVDAQLLEIASKVLQ